MWSRSYRMNINQLFFSWVEYLEGSNQNEFCNKTNISEVTVSRIKNGIQKPSKSTIKRLQDVYGISVQEYLAGVQEYEKLRKQKELADLKPKDNLLDPEKASNVYALSGIRPSLNRSRFLGSRWDKQFEKNPKDFIFVYVDLENTHFKFGKIVCVCNTLKPEINDIILIYNNGNSTASFQIYDNKELTNTIIGIVVSS